MNSNNRQNKIEELPFNISRLSRLEVLSVSSNNLDALPLGITSIQSLRKLYANGNKISEISADYCELPHIEVCVLCL